MNVTERNDLQIKARRINKYKNENFKSVSEFHENLLDRGYSGKLNNQYYSDRISAMASEGIESNLKNKSEKELKTIIDYVYGIHSFLFDSKLKFCGDTPLSLLMTKSFDKPKFPIFIAQEVYKVDFDGNGTVTINSKGGLVYKAKIRKKNNHFVIYWTAHGLEFKIEGFDHDQNLKYLPVVIHAVSKDLVSASYGIFTQHIYKGIEKFLMHHFLDTSYSTIQTPYDIPKPNEKILHPKSKKFYLWNLKYFMKGQLYSFKFALLTCIILLSLFLLLLFSDLFFQLMDFVFQASK